MSSYLTIFSTKRRTRRKFVSIKGRIDEMVYDEMSCTLRIPVVRNKILASPLTSVNMCAKNKQTISIQ